LHRRFAGFYPETLDFFQQIRFHNEKPWFEAHRDDFEAYVKSPMEALALDLEPLMQRMDPRLDLRLHRIVSRIYRDARYAKGQPYRDHMWMSYKPVGKSNSEAFTYYFFIEESAWGMGVGLYNRVPDIQEGFRRRLMTEGERWREILADPDMKEFTVSGDSPRRKPSVELPEDLMRWYAYRKFSFDQTQPISPMVFSAGLLDRVWEGFTQLEPVYRFVTGMNEDDQSNIQKG
jgi:uncharacterized protein (TIGR02453 family)